ncbi:MAG: hypothetical protein LBR85_03285 [Oscillospiraceae bacterium]|nr:hypothetical protein [Oscillospiraceae bacterium]
MTDYKTMYYHMAGRMSVAIDTMAVAVEALEATTKSLANLTDKLKKSLLVTEDMFISESESGEESDGQT